MKKLLFILFLLILASHSQAQVHNLSFQFNRILFKDLVDTVEKKIRIKMGYAFEQATKIRKLPEDYK